MQKERFLTLGGENFHLNENGYLRDFECWKRELAEAMAQQDGLQLDEEHWSIILLLRQYYRDYRIVPAAVVLRRLLTRRLGPEVADSRHLYRLFPEGPARQASRYAGLPKPESCL